MVDLNRYKPANTPGIPHEQGNLYRAHGSDGLRDMRKSGLVQGPGKGGAFSTFWSENAPLDRYAAPHRAGAGAIVELKGPVDPSRFKQVNGYPVSWEQNPVNRYKDPIRVYEPNADGTYKRTYDNATPWKRGLRSAGYSLIGNTGMKALAFGGEVLSNPALAVAAPLVEMANIAHNDPKTRGVFIPGLR